jgi:hypothetical protein
MKLKRGRDNKGPRIRSHEVGPVSYDQQRPVFSLHSQVVGWTVDQCSDEHKVAFLDAIHRRSQLTWIQLRSADHRKLGFEPLPRELVEKGVRIPVIITEDAMILCFRCHVGKMRALGFREDATFHVIWIDCDGQIYDHD